MVSKRSLGWRLVLSLVGLWGFGESLSMMVRTGLSTCIRVLLIVMVLVGLVAAGCGRKSSTSAGVSATPGAACQQVGSVNFDKTRFVLHAGLGLARFIILFMRRIKRALCTVSCHWVRPGWRPCSQSMN